MGLCIQGMLLARRHLPAGGPCSMKPCACRGCTLSCAPADSRCWLCAGFAASTCGLQGLTEKGIDTLRADLAQVDSECAEEIRKTVHENYKQFIQASQVCCT